MELFVKNMVCDRCIMMVKRKLEALGIDYSDVELGEISLRHEISQEKISALRHELNTLGFELLDDRKSSIVSQIKTAIVKFVHSDEEKNIKISALLAEKSGMDYNYLSAIFSAVEGITIEKYVILQRVERVKELLAYDELTVNEIADRLGYSSVQHLSQQFKKTTGLTPSQFKRSSDLARKPLDEI
ncbi:MAG TPA: AraC family transcriptional regulator [Chitinophagaceae bacterium]|nr:AraC family transcriptional regulator [Chitinophagaceae bacterium]